MHTARAMSESIATFNGMIVFRELDPTLPRREFDCGNTAMNEWFWTQAGQQERKDAVRTHVGLATFDSSIAAYYSLAAHRIELDTTAATRSFSSRRYPVPALLIARLAVDRRYQGPGIGTLALADALQRCASVPTQIGVEVVLVDTIDDAAAAFYAHHGLDRLTDDGRRWFVTTRHLRSEL